MWIKRFDLGLTIQPAIYLNWWSWVLNNVSLIWGREKLTFKWGQGSKTDVKRIERTFKAKSKHKKASSKPSNFLSTYSRSGVTFIFAKSDHQFKWKRAFTNQLCALKSSDQRRKNSEGKKENEIWKWVMNINEKEKRRNIIVINFIAFINIERRGTWIEH